MKSFRDLLEDISAPKPQPLYVGVKFSAETHAAILNAMEEMGVQAPVSADDLHCTLIYSKKPVTGYESPHGQVHYTASPKSFEIFGKEKNCLVMTLDSPSLESRHKELMEDLDASWDFPEYRPHVTLSYDCAEFDLKRSVPSITLIANQEYSEPLDEEWVSGNS